MGNMSYCRFRNTLGDLQDCKDALGDGCAEDLSPDERRAAKRLLELCKEISEQYTEEDLQEPTEEGE